MQEARIKKIPSDNGDPRAFGINMDAERKRWRGVSTKPGEPSQTSTPCFVSFHSHIRIAIRSATKWSPEGLRFCPREDPRVTARTKGFEFLSFFSTVVGNEQPVLSEKTGYVEAHTEPRVTRSDQWEFSV